MIDIPGCSERTNYIFFIQTCFALSNNENSRWYMQVCLSTLKFRQHNKFPIFRRVSANGGGAGPPGPPGHGATARRIFLISSSRRVSSGSVWSLRCVTSSRHASPRRNVKRRDHRYWIHAAMKRSKIYTPRRSETRGETYNDELLDAATNSRNEYSWSGKIISGQAQRSTIYHFRWCAW
jgi:hypothetical protein